MISPEMAKPATVSSEPALSALDVEQLAGPLHLMNAQTSALRKHFAVGYYLATTLVPRVYGLGPR
jgi:hypothetical protein